MRLSLHSSVGMTSKIDGRTNSSRSARLWGFYRACALFNVETYIQPLFEGIYPGMAALGLPNNHNDKSHVLTLHDIGYLDISLPVPLDCTRLHSIFRDPITIPSPSLFPVHHHHHPLSPSPLLSPHQTPFLPLPLYHAHAPRHPQTHPP